jgi:CRISPR type III-B/RAMP module RAMP protein Cmr6
MSGGVMENAGVCLDRYGMPYIPGSAIKGCARRAALRALREWTAAGEKPEAPLHSAVEPFSSPEEMLAHIARVFGWVEQDWTHPSSDFLWACSDQKDVLSRTRALPALDAASRAGSVCFFSAYPDADPGLELDILTCHHGEYYGNDQADFAPDTENPNPVTFPAVKPQTEGHFFTFAIAPAKPAFEPLLTYAKAWLQIGLEVFGIGAKTAAGYGWFEVAATTGMAIEKLKKQRENEARVWRESLETDLRTALKALPLPDCKTLCEQTRDIQQTATALQNCFSSDKQTQEGFPWFESADSVKILSDAFKAERPKLIEKILAAETADLPPEAQADRRLQALTDQQLFQKLVDFERFDAVEQAAIVRALRGDRAEVWERLKALGSKGKFVQAADAIRRTSKTLNLGKMP